MLRCRPGAAARGQAWRSKARRSKAWRKQSTAKAKHGESKARRKQSTAQQSTAKAKHGETKAKQSRAQSLRQEEVSSRCEIETKASWSLSAVSPSLYSCSAPRMKPLCRMPRNTSGRSVSMLCSMKKLNSSLPPGITCRHRPRIVRTRGDIEA